MSEMIERVAKAIKEAALNNMIDNLNNEDASLLARAAIEAMRDLTDEMSDAADWQQQSEINAYHRAIDAALIDKNREPELSPTDGGFQVRTLSQPRTGR